MPRDPGWVVSIAAPAFRAGNPTSREVPPVSERRLAQRRLAERRSLFDLGTREAEAAARERRARIGARDEGAPPMTLEQLHAQRELEVRATTSTPRRDANHPKGLLDHPKGLLDAARRAFTFVSGAGASCSDRRSWLRKSAAAALERATDRRR